MATYYIDPTATGANTGLSPTDAWTSWTHTLFAGNVYLQRVGTTVVLPSTGWIACSGLNGTSSLPTTFGTYSMPSDTATKATVDGRNMDDSVTSNRGILDIRDCSWVNVSNFKLINNGKYSTTGTDYGLSFNHLNTGVLITRSSNVSVTNCEIEFCVGGIYVWCVTNPVKFANISIDNNLVHDCVTFGIGGSMGGAQAGTVLTATDRLQITNNEIYNVGVNLWDPIANGVLGSDSASPWLSGTPNGPKGGISIMNYYQLPFTTPTETLATNTLIRNNKIYNNLGYGISVAGLGAGSIIEGNEVYRNGIAFDGISIDGKYDTHSIWVGGCFDTIIRANKVHDNGGAINSSYGSGIGVFLDQDLTLPANSSTTPSYMRYGSRCLVTGNIVYNQWQNSTNASNASAGIFCYLNSNSKICGNTITDCRQGIVVAGGTFPHNTSLSNNALVILAISGTGSVVTATTRGAHGLVEGDILSFSGSTTAGYNVTPAVVTSIVSPTQFTYSGTGVGTPGTMPTFVYVMQATNNIVSNNTIADCSEQGLVGAGYSLNTLFTNNIVDSVLWGIHKQTTGSALGVDNNLQIKNNIVHSVYSFTYIGGNYVGSSANLPGLGQNFVDLGVLPDTNTILDPLLDPTTYKPLPESPCIGAGTFVGYYSDATGRPYSIPPSIGAYEDYSVKQDEYTE